MNNIAKYPKDWYEDIVHKTKPKKKSASSRKESDAEDEAKKSNQDHLPSLSQERTLITSS